MKEDKKKRSRLMASMFKIGCVGFGGGSALIPVIEKEVVEEQKLVSKKEYDKDVIVASITPGALPVEIATGIGKDAYGSGGMLTASLLMAFPGVLMTVLLLSVLSKLDEALLIQIECLSIGLTAFISCLLTEYAVKSMKEARDESKGRFNRAFIIMAGVFLLSCGKTMHNIFGIESDPVFGLSTIQVLGISFFGILYTHCKFTKKNIAVSAVTIGLYIACVGKAGIIQNEYIEKALFVFMFVLSMRGLYRSIAGAKGNKNKYKKIPAGPFIKEMIVWIVFLVVLTIPAFIITKDTVIYQLRGLASSIISFGGGDAYLSVADGMFVSTGMITESEFYSQLVSVVNVLPGSILCKTLAGVGYYMGYNIDGSIIEGFLVALAGFSCSVAASGCVFCIIYYVYESFEKLNVFRMISRWIRPIIAGLLLNVMMSMVYQNVKTGQGLGISAAISLIVTIIIYAIAMWLLNVKKKSNGILILISAILGLVMCNVVFIIAF